MRIEQATGDITAERVDAIVTAANSSLLGVHPASAYGR